MENSNIAWTHHTQNFWLGCEKIAPECAHCYIGRRPELVAKRLPENWGEGWPSVCLCARLTIEPSKVITMQEAMEEIKRDDFRGLTDPPA